MAGLATALSSSHAVRNDQQLPSLSQEFRTGFKDQVL
jgi:hypothetical protein